MKKKCLIIFSLPHVHNWETEIVDKFKIIFDVKYVFANQLFNKGGTQYLIEFCNKMIKDESIEVVIFDTDFTPFVDANVIKKINLNTFKIIISLDNIVHDVLNVIHGSYSNLVLTCDPIDVLKFNEYNIESHFFTLEGSKKLYHNMQLEKDIDILFYGDIKNKFGRSDFINKLKEKGFNLKVVGPPENLVSNEELVKLINRSKIVLNFSYTNLKKDFKNWFPPRDNELNTPLLQFKGRILQVGLCNTMCLSEFAPSIRLLYNDMEVPTFKNFIECEDMIKLYLDNDILRNNIATNLNKKVHERFEDEQLMKQIFQKVVTTNSNNTLALKYNSYYKRYITRFKISLLIFKPILLFKEIKYLITNDLYKFTFDFIPFLSQRIYKAIRVKFI